MLLANDAKRLYESKLRESLEATHLSWFGTQILVQVIANEGRFPLLGTELLAGRELLINYRTAKIRLT